jgi:hypothetical protein
MRQVAAFIAAAMLWTAAERVWAWDMQGYLAELRSQGRERVCVEFEGRIDLSVLSSYGVEVLREMKSASAVICHIDGWQIDRLRQLPGIKAVEPDVAMYVPPVPEYSAAVRTESRGELTALAYTGVAQVRWNNAEVGLNSKAAWDNYGLDGSGVSIALIDTGVNYKLADLAGNYLGGAGFYALWVGDSSNSFFISNLISALEWAAHKGSLDLMALHWPIRYDIGFSDYAYVIEGVPVFYAGTRMRQRVTLTNMTETVGNTSERIESLSTKVMQSEMAEPEESNVYPPAVQWLPTAFAGQRRRGLGESVQCVPHPAGPGGWTD